MMNSHPKEKEIQEYILDRESCPTQIVGHIESCLTCQEEVRNYQLLFAELKQEPAPSFDFDLAGMVLSKLPSPEPLMTTERFIFSFLVVFICLCLATPVYIFWPNILYMFSGIPVYFIYVIFGSAICILVFKIISLFRKYQNQMRILNISYPA
jgi:hypothetical protein